MKILIVSDVPTHPVRAGNRKWILSQVEIMEELGHEVHFLYVKNEFPGKSDYAETRAYWADRFHYFHKPVLYKWRTLVINKYRRLFCRSYWKCDDHYPPFLGRAVKNLIREYGFEACLVNYYYLTKLFEEIDVPLKALFTHDCFSYKYLVTGLKRVESLSASEEAKAMQRSPHIFALQDEEAVFFRKLSPRSRIYNVYGKFSFVETPVVSNKNILFLSGSNKYNIEGIRWFVREIFPLILASYPDAKLLIGGSICHSLSDMELSPQVQLTGIVDDVREFYSRGDVAVNPVFQGTGLKIKTFEAISFGKLTIVHPHSTEGIYKKEEAPLLVPYNAKQWLEYFHLAWSAPEVAADYKKRDREYLEDMNLWIYSRYREFFNYKSRK